MLSELFIDRVIIHGLSTEGSQFSIYKDKNSCTRLITAEHLGETGKNMKNTILKMIL